MAASQHQPLTDPIPITDQRWPENLKPTVSVRCITYNHAQFIEQCIQGMLMQKTTFPVEIIIHDDASNDGTAEIIGRYLEKYPDLIKGILQPQNLHSQGISRDQFMAPLTRGHYIAVCEGDDYWIDPLKLERQVRAIKQHPGCDLCIHKAILSNHETGEEQIIGGYCDSDCVIDVTDIIRKRFGIIPTASALITRSAMQEVQDFRASRPWLTVGDIYLLIFGAKRGGALYIDEAMSVYRAFVPSSWSVSVREKPEKLRRHREARIRSFRELDRLTAGAFHASFKAANRNQARHILSDRHARYFTRLVFRLKNADLLDWSDVLRRLQMLRLVRGLRQALRSARMGQP